MTYGADLLTRKELNALMQRQKGGKLEAAVGGLSFLSEFQVYGGSRGGSKSSE